MSHFVSDTKNSSILDIFRLTAILGVIFVHIPYAYPSLSVEGGPQSYLSGILDLGWGDKLILFMQYGIGRVASPALSIISAWLLMKSLDSGRGVTAMLKKKTGTLLAPYYIWNFIAFAVFVVAKLAVGDTGAADEYLAHYLRDAVPLFQWPLNIPLHFLIDLFIIITMFLLVFRPFSDSPRAMITIAFATTFIFSVLGKSASWYGDNASSFLPRVDLTFYFFIGIALYRIGPRIFSEKFLSTLSRTSVMTALIIASALSAPVLYYCYNMGTIPGWEQIGMMYLVLGLRFIFSLLLFSVSIALWDSFKRRPPSRLAFRLFCSHVILVFFALKFLSLFGLPEPVIFFGCFLLITAGGYVINILLNRLERSHETGRVLRYV